MNHAYFHGVGLKVLQEIFKAELDVGQIAGAFILSVFPNGAQVCLQYKFIPPVLQGFAQLSADFWIGCVQVYVVDALFFSRREQFFHPGFIVGEALAAKADLADG